MDKPADVVDNKVVDTPDIGQLILLSSTITDHQDLADPLRWKPWPPKTKVPVHSSNALTSVPTTNSYISNGSSSPLGSINHRPGSKAASLPPTTDSPVDNTSSILSGTVSAPPPLPMPPSSQKTNMYTKCSRDPSLTIDQDRSHVPLRITAPVWFPPTSSTHIQRNQPPLMKKKLSINGYTRGEKSYQSLEPKPCCCRVRPVQILRPKPIRFRIQASDPILHQREKTKTSVPPSLLSLRSTYNSPPLSPADFQSHHSLMQESNHISLPPIQLLSAQQDHSPVQLDRPILYQNEEIGRSDSQSLSSHTSSINRPSLSSKVDETINGTVQQSLNTDDISIEPLKRTKNYEKPINRCHECERIFVSEAGLWIHKDTASNIPFVCDQCKKKCCSRTGLNLHIRTAHTEVMKFKCKFCPKVFFKQLILRDHIFFCHMGEQGISQDDVDKLLSESVI